MKALLVPLLALLATALVPVPATQAGSTVFQVHATVWQWAPQAMVVPAGSSVLFINPVVSGAGFDHTWTSAASETDAMNDIPNDPADTNCVVGDEAGEDAKAHTCDHALPAGSTFEITFGEAGRFVYYCRLHLLQRMIGEVVVV